MSDTAPSPLQPWRGSPEELDALRDELAASAGFNAVGHVLHFENERVRVWHIRLAPGERLGFHHHELDYFWTVTTDGQGLAHLTDGQEVRVDYKAGDTKFLTFGAGEHMRHDLVNCGDSELVFVTVELLQSANPARPVPPGTKRG